MTRSSLGSTYRWPHTRRDRSNTFGLKKCLVPNGSFVRKAGGVRMKGEFGQWTRMVKWRFKKRHHLFRGAGFSSPLLPGEELRIRVGGAPAKVDLPTVVAVHSLVRHNSKKGFISPVEFAACPSHAVIVEGWLASFSLTFGHHDLKQEQRQEQQRLPRESHLICRCLDYPENCALGASKASNKRRKERGGVRAW